MINRSVEYTRMAAVEEKHWWYRSLHLLVYKEISKRHQQKDLFIVDAGCGTGGLMKFLQNKGYRNLEGFDISNDAIAFCKAANLKVELNSIRSIAEIYSPQSVDIIVSNDTFYFFSEEERRAILQAFWHVLKPGGMVILNLPALEAFKGIHDLSVGIEKRFTKKAVKEMINTKQFHVSTVKFWPFILSPIIFFSRFFQRIQLKMNKNVEIHSDVNLPPNSINKVLFFITKMENTLLKYKPFGSSLFLVLTKKRSISRL